MPGPLEGIKVLDITRFQNGPSATRQLADYGADVVKIEALDGEETRTNPSFTTRDGYPWMQEAMNRSKKSVTLDLRNPESKEIMKKLVQWADVLAENFRVGVLERWGYGYEQCKQWNPKLIYASNSGFGPSGEWSERPAYDMVAQAYAGIMHGQGGGPDHEPVPVEWALSDEVGAMNFASGILMAIVSTQRTGEGQHLQTSQLGATIQFQTNALTANLHGNGRQRNDGKAPQSMAKHLQTHYKTSDGKFFIAAPVEEKQFRRFAEAIGRGDLLTDDRTKTINDRRKNADHLVSTLQETFIKDTRKNWLDAIVAAEVPCGPVNSYKDLVEDQHVFDNGYLDKVQHPTHGEQIVIGTPHKFSGTPAPPTGVSSPLGAHTAEMLQKVGFNADEIAGFNKAGAIKLPHTEKEAKARL